MKGKSMDFFDIGAGELLLILVIALIVMGPGKIIKFSQELGKMVHSFRKASSELNSQITRELDVEEEDQPSPPEKCSTPKPKNRES